MRPSDLAALLRNLRLCAGLSVTEAAAKMGVDPFTLAQWESGLNLTRIAVFHTALERAYNRRISITPERKT